MVLSIDNNWGEALQKEFEKDYFTELCSFIDGERASGKVIYPPEGQVFKALDLCPPQNVKVVILGQDPYHAPNQAMGLSFSVNKEVKAPPSLKNIFKELESDMGLHWSGATDLTPWARQGVLLLNAILTVEDGKPASHNHIGWSRFTDSIIKLLSDNYEGIVFMLWGNYAKSKKVLIDSERHLILEAAHPSPLARGAFFGSKPFSQANAYLLSIGKEQIDWSI